MPKRLGSRRRRLVSWMHLFEHLYCNHQRLPHIYCARISRDYSVTLPSEAIATLIRSGAVSEPGGSARRRPCSVRRNELVVLAQNVFVWISSAVSHACFYLETSPLKTFASSARMAMLQWTGGAKRSRGELASSIVCSRQSKVCCKWLAVYYVLLLPHRGCSWIQMARGKVSKCPYCPKQVWESYLANAGQYNFLFCARQAATMRIVLIRSSLHSHVELGD